MRRLQACSLVATIAGCDTPGPRCVVRVGYGFAPTAMLAVDDDGDGQADAVAASPARQTVTVDSA